MLPDTYAEDPRLTATCGGLLASISCVRCRGWGRLLLSVTCFLDLHCVDLKQYLQEHRYREFSLTVPVNPKPFLQNLTGKMVIVKLKWGMEYKGTLMAFRHLLVTDLSGTEEFIDGQCSGNLGDILIRCNNVMYLRGVPERLTAWSAASPTPSTSSASAPAPVDPAQLPPALRDIIALFQSVPDERTRYQQLLAYAAHGTDTQDRRQPHLRVRLPGLGPGLAGGRGARLRQLRSRLRRAAHQGPRRAPARDVVMVPVEFIEMLGIRQSLSPSRNIGLLNMINLMKLKALEIAAGQKVTASPEIRQERTETPTVEKGEPQFEDFGGQHKGHAGVAGSDGETHFNARVVSKEFEGKSMLKRHRVVYDLLQDALKSGLHALSIDAKTPSEV
ncbi:sufE-like protein 1, chloroplastic/mitochondrial [Hordeum vulgare]|nr:sufE-like protein 1, chloroplastic/mitochondrial [Hordeum vulgare]